MATWTYKGKNPSGKLEEGEFEAASQEEAMSLLRRKRLTDVNIKKKPLSASAFKLGSGIKSVDIARFTRQFAVMNAAGLALLNALQVLEEQSENPAMRDVVRRVAASVSGGTNLSQALALHPKVFNKLYVHMVAAGEAGGALESVLNRLAEYQESSERLKRKVKGAMTYPVIVMIVAIAVVTVMLTLVVPKFAEIFTSSGTALPGPTAVVMSISNFLRDYFLVLLIGLIALIGGLRHAISTPKGRFAFDKLKIKLPKVRDLEIKSAIARFSRTVGTLLNSGVSIMDALDVTAKTAGNVVIEKAILRIREQIAGGKPLAEPMKEVGIFPGMVVQMVAVGEKTGGLGSMLTKVADFYDEEVDAAVEALTSMIEPLIIVFLGGIIGFIMIAMYMPMFSMSDTVS
ncbi:MAG TPA: type II secretion system F family protein [Fibrobacteraceae bacterium]|nr:type II secretion system F family protein [Fibrobacteraceae bacterium]